MTAAILSQILGGNYKAHIEELTERQQSLGAAIGSERRAISFSDAVTQSIDEDDYLPKVTPVGTPVGEGGKFGEGSVCKIEKISSIEPPSELSSIVSLHHFIVSSV